MGNNELTAIVSTITVGIICLFIWGMTYLIARWHIEWSEMKEENRRYERFNKR